MPFYFLYISVIFYSPLSLSQMNKTLMLRSTTTATPPGWGRRRRVRRRRVTRVRRRPAARLIKRAPQSLKRRGQNAWFVTTHPVHNNPVGFLCPKWVVMNTRRSDAAAQRLSRLVLFLRKRLPGLDPCSLTPEIPSATIPIS